MIEALQRLDRDARGRRHRHRPRRRLGGGPAAVLRRGAGPGGAPRAAPRWSPRSATSRTRPLLDLVADVRASTPTDAAKLVVPDVAEELRRVAQAAATGSGSALGRLAGPRAGRPRRAAVAAGAWPTRATCSTTRAEEARARRATAPAARSAHRLDRAADDIDHHRARARALSPLATLRRGYAVLQDADGHVVTSPRRRRGRRAVSVAGGRRPRHADHDRPSTTQHDPETEETDDRARRQDAPSRRPLSYEAGREELVEVVRRLEAGGTTLEESLALWERGEQLARLPGVARRRPRSASTR